AYAALEKADSLGLDTEHFLVLLAQGKRLLGRRSDALDDINKAIRRDPGLASAWNECGNIYADLGRITQAQKAYQKAIELSSDQVQPLLNMSALLVSINRLDEALDLINTAQIDQEIDLRKFMNKRGFEFLEQLT
ncbi:MAG: tetratricopeptide repeat protein, partial [Anaerolineae bacterium]|nr:tetratricopeptide repeat protein [Anaerolineae bacterium]